MPNRVLEALLNEQINLFRNAFSSVSKAAFYDEQEGELIHAGEFGMYREAVCREFLRFFVANKLDISQGFLMNADDAVSSQCDIVIYDRNSTPLIQSESRQRFFPVETVCAVGEVKSNVSQTELKKALNKLAKVKAMRDAAGETIIWQRSAHPYNPEKYFNDQLFTFLICERFEFSFQSLDVHRLYDNDLMRRHRHNIVLSLQDGVLLYAYDERGSKVVPYPEMYIERGKRELGDTVLESDSQHTHLKTFVHYLFYATSHTTILHADLGKYISPPSTYTTGIFTD